MDDRSNTIAGWVLAGGIVALGLSIVSGMYFHGEAPEKEGGLYKSIDQGKSFKQVSDNKGLVNRPFYYTNIELDPTNPNIIFSNANPLLKSIDGGKTWKRMSVPHGDNHDLWIDPNNPDRMINANDGGGNVTINGGKSWTEQDYITRQLYHVMTTSDVPYHVAGAQQDNSTVAVPSDGWNHKQGRGPNHGWYYAVGGGESGWITQHPTKPDIFYAGSIQILDSCALNEFVQDTHCTLSCYISMSHTFEDQMQAIWERLD